MLCPNSYTSFETLRQECIDCTTKECMIPEPKTEYGLWYDEMIDDIKSQVTEFQFTARWAIIEMKHSMGMRIVQDYDKWQNYGDGILQRIAESLSCSYETVAKCVQFARKYPDVNQLPVGKNANWGAVLKLLPDNSEPKQEPEREKCPKCGRVMPKGGDK